MDDIFCCKDFKNIFINTKLIQRSEAYGYVLYIVDIDKCEFNSYVNEYFTPMYYCPFCGKYIDIFYLNKSMEITVEV